MLQDYVKKMVPEDMWPDFPEIPVELPVYEVDPTKFIIRRSLTDLYNDVESDEAFAHWTQQFWSRIGIHEERVQAAERIK